ncbi:DUF7010 family protein [Asaia krungthepensis]|uniref:Uncharacterized protein n=1 Tax=Asaia krungthepensis NRIC 0535 TaxID=1307925 RepID=A0ABQ0Q6H1_9PROT|nr:hypothetical protein [Asaia krungthepensis]GBQ93586.1 hypothetical protein AA0535_2878 [Asaia krungthepensis NRIC 0535]
MTATSREKLADLRRDYLASCTASMPISGLICWAALSVTAMIMEAQLPYFTPFVAAALPLPLALFIDRITEAPGLRRDASNTPITRLFMQFITVTGLLIPFAPLAAIEARDPVLLMLRIAIFSGLVWVPHGWGGR